MITGFTFFYPAIYKRNNIRVFFFVDISIFEHCFLGKRGHVGATEDLPDSYLAIDGVEFGRGNKIPLWLFGFLY